MSRRRGFKLREVAREFKADNGVPKVELSCGHIKTDPIFHYGNETAVKVRAAFHQLANTARKIRCYQCGKGE